MRSRSLARCPARAVAAAISGAAFNVGALASILYLVKVRAARRGTDTGYLARVPAPAKLDLFAFRVHAFAFVLWTFTVAAGAIWAEYAWGRYWGWDPKEVWSLVAFLAYMAILHLKVDKVIGTFGAALISILAFQTILMTYLGVNYVLNVGMHSYGMGDSPIVKWMVLVALVEVVFLAVCGVAYRDRKRLLAAA